MSGQAPFAYVKAASLSPDQVKADVAFLTRITDTDAALLAHIGRAILTARMSHSRFATDFADACRAEESEFLEFKSKVLVGRVEDAHVEAVDCIVTLARLINEEYGQESAS